LEAEEQRYAVPGKRKLDREQEQAVHVAAMRGSTLSALATAHWRPHMA
jgi:hypothetical protein